MSNRAWVQEMSIPQPGVSPRPPRSERLSQTKLPLASKALQEANTRAWPSSSQPGGLSHLSRPRGTSSAVGPGWQCHCWLMDHFTMRLLNRLPAVPAQAPDQHGCTAPRPSHKCRNWETAHPSEQQLICTRRQAEDRRQDGGRQ